MPARPRRRPTPAVTFRNETVYRSGPRGAAARMIDCGFLMKPTPMGGYVNRVTPRYIGVYVLRGAGRFTDGHGRTHPVEAGCFIPHPPNRRHSVQPTPDGRWAEFFFSAPAVLWRSLSELGAVGRDDAPLRPGLDAGLMQRFERLLHDTRAAEDRDAPLLLAAVHELVALTARLHRRGAAGPAVTDAAAAERSGLDEARRLLGDPDADTLQLPQLAQRLGMTYERFRKAFRAHVGTPPHEFRIRRRIDRARALIAQSRLSNKQVAYALGYPDPFTFSKQFKLYTGQSPSAFRRLL